jgi:hypothetical protein
MNQQQTETVTFAFSVTVTGEGADFARAAMTRTSGQKRWEKAATMEQSSIGQCDPSHCRRFFASLRRRESKFTIRYLGRG